MIQMTTHKARLTEHRNTESINSATAGQLMRHRCATGHLRKGSHSLGHCRGEEENRETARNVSATSFKHFQMCN